MLSIKDIYWSIWLHKKRKLRRDSWEALIYCQVGQQGVTKDSPLATDSWPPMTASLTCGGQCYL